MRWIGRRLSYANVVSSIALFLALSGGAFALGASPLVDHNGVIWACVQGGSHNLQVVRPGGACYNGSIALTLNQTGKPGERGRAGAQGPKGDTGGAGAQGPKGNTGTSGPQGASGPQGSAGATGAQGPNGETGAAGQQGPKGDTGATGATGAQGAKGDTGVTGAQGSKGATGATGPQGPQGAMGATGLPGSQGPAGPQGPQGVPGPVHQVVGVVQSNCTLQTPITGVAVAPNPAPPATATGCAITFPASDFTNNPNLVLMPINGGGGNPTSVLQRQNADGSWSASYTFGSSPPPLVNFIASQLSS